MGSMFSVLFIPTLLSSNTARFGTILNLLRDKLDSCLIHSMLEFVTHREFLIWSGRTEGMGKGCHGLPCSPKPSLFWPARVCRPEKQSSYGQLQDRITHPDVFEHIGTGLPCEQAHCLHLPNWTGFEPFRIQKRDANICAMVKAWYVWLCWVWSSHVIPLSLSSGIEKDWMEWVQYIESLWMGPSLCDLCGKIYRMEQ